MLSSFTLCYLVIFPLWNSVEKSFLLPILFESTALLIKITSVIHIIGSSMDQKHFNNFDNTSKERQVHSLKKQCYQVKFLPCNCILFNGFVQLQYNFGHSRLICLGFVVLGECNVYDPDPKPSFWEDHLVCDRMKSVHLILSV